jgi:tetratricopeptide (TPR) repeat protein
MLGIMLILSCKNSTVKTPAADTDPVFQTDTKLKNITDEIKKSPKDASLYFQRGTMLRKMQFDSLAVKDDRTAISLDSNKAEYYSAIGDLLFEDKDIAGSLIWIQKAIEKNPKDRKAHLKVAKLFLYIRDYPKAFAEINVVLRQDVYDPEAYFLKGMLYKDSKDTAKAISNFQTAVQVSPDYKDAVVQLGLLYSAKKDPIALKYLENAYKIDTTDVFPIYAMGVYYQDTKDYVKAKELYKRCIIQDRHSADAYFNMGYILMQEDSLAKSYRQYDMVIKIDPRNPTAYYNRGLCSEMMDSVKKAADDYRIALSLDSSYSSPKEALKRLKGK